MKPEIARVLEVCAIDLMGDIAPNVAPSYRQATVLSTAVILTSIREELDRIAERRVDENRALRALFSEAGDAIEDADLRSRVADAAAGDETDFRISALDAANTVLRALLIELHTHVESQGSAAARRVETSIWRELCASTERRRLSLGAF